MKHTKETYIREFVSNVFVILYSPETHLMPKLKETGETVFSTIVQNRRNLIDQVDRLQAVMETKRKIASGLFDEIDVNLDDVDLYSDVTSHTGIMSQQSR